MDWRLQITSLCAGIFLTIIPLSAYFEPPWDPATASAWNLAASVMQYFLIGGMAIAVLGLLWRGPIGPRSATAQIVLSIGVGAWMFLVSAALIMYWFTYSLPCPDIPTPPKCVVSLAEYPVAEFSWVALLIPALSLISSIVWLVRHPMRNVGDALRQETGSLKQPSQLPYQG